MNQRSSRAPRFAVTAIELLERPRHAAAAVPLRRGDGDGGAAGVRARIASAATDGREAHGHDRRADGAEVVRQVARRGPTATTSTICVARCALAADGLLRELGAAHRVRPRGVPLSRAAATTARANGLNPLTHVLRRSPCSTARSSTRCAGMRDVSFVDGVLAQSAGPRRADLTPDLARLRFRCVSRDARCADVDRCAPHGRHGRPADRRRRRRGHDPDDGLPVSLADVIARYRQSLVQAEARRRRRRRHRPARARSHPCSIRCRISRDARRQRAVPGCRDARRIRCRAARRASGLARLAKRCATSSSRFRARARSTPTCTDRWTRDAADHRRVRCDARRLPAARARSATRACRARAARASTSRCSTLRAARAGMRRRSRRPRSCPAKTLPRRPGLAVQQDLALAALLGFTHVERNGHHYAAGIRGAARERARAAYVSGRASGPVRRTRRRRAPRDPAMAASHIASLDARGFRIGDMARCRIVDTDGRRTPHPATIRRRTFRHSPHHDRHSHRHHHERRHRTHGHQPAPRPLDQRDPRRRAASRSPMAGASCRTRSWSAATRQARRRSRARTASRAGRPTSTRRSPTATTRVYFDCGVDRPAPVADPARRSPPASTSTARSPSRRRVADALDLYRRAEARGRQARRRAGQAVAAGPAEAARC